MTSVKNNFTTYRTVDQKIPIDVRFADESVWLSQTRMAQLFNTRKQNISSHIKNIFTEKELVESSVVKDFLTTVNDGKAYRTRFYNLVSLNNYLEANHD